MERLRLLLSFEADAVSLATKVSSAVLDERGPHLSDTAPIVIPGTTVPGTAADVWLLTSAGSFFVIGDVPVPCEKGKRE